MKKNEISTFTATNFENMVLNAKEDSFEIGEKVVKDTALTTYHARASILATAKAISDKALCIECARLNPADVEKIGYSSVSAFISDCFGSTLDNNTISRYIRVGKIFADFEADGYKWKAPISQAVSVTNLGQIIALVFEECPTDDKGKKKDIYSLSRAELNTLFDKFVEKYQPDENGGMPLQGTNKALRTYLQNLKKKAEEIPTTATEITDEQTDSQTDSSAEDFEKVKAEDDAKFERWALALNEMLACFSDNAEIENAVLKVMELVHIV